VSRYCLLILFDIESDSDNKSGGCEKEPASCLLIGKLDDAFWIFGFF
jgi:hypothetical protein